jgi:hypothetical protein
MEATTNRGMILCLRLFLINQIQYDSLHEGRPIAAGLSWFLARAGYLRTPA